MLRIEQSKRLSESFGNSCEDDDGLAEADELRSLAMGQAKGTGHLP